MDKTELNYNEKIVLHGLVKYPNLPDRELADLIKIKHSTITTIRNRLRKNDFFRTLNSPNLEYLGSKMLVVIYTKFSPLIPLDERVDITGKTIEVFDEIFLSVGEQDKGFSLSLSEDYATIGKINDIRTQTFGVRGLLEETYPNMVIFPFAISKIYRFFDFAPLIHHIFQLTPPQELEKKSYKYITPENIVTLSETEKNVYCTLIQFPEMSSDVIGAELGISRHTVSRIKRRFEQDNLIRKIYLPNLKKLQFQILAFYHIQFSPSTPPDIERDQALILQSDSSIFFASRNFEAIMICIYTNYNNYRLDKNRITQTLKENQWVTANPLILSYSLDSLVFIKDFKFTPITAKVLKCDMWVKKLLNI
ncbi:MAG: helix-turn-helix domain-containing protein [Candidatus Thermoplasmatota archaeon]|nr:helix-turn-helix domain-containing protein [Candidatus Thermoplasmatota archaeon]